LAESNPHAVVARRPERQARNEVGHVLGNHLAVVDEPARTQDHALIASNASWGRVLVLDLVALRAYPPCDSCHELADHDFEAVQVPMNHAPKARRKMLILEPDDATGAVDDQSSGPRLKLDAHSLSDRDPP